MDQLNTKDINVLYVDDEKNSLSAFKNLYRRKFNIFTANSGEEGLDILASQPIQVIITDQRMPNMQGTEFLKLIKNKWPDLKFILLTAYNDIDVFKEAMDEVGVFWYLNKPFDPDQMEQIILKANKTYLAEKKLKDSEEKFRGVFNTMIDVFTRTDMNGVCELVSPSIYNLIGYSQEEVLGRNMADFYVNPDERNLMLQSILKSKKAKNFKFDLVHKEGKKVAVSTNAKVIFDSKGKPKWVEGNIRDIRKQKKAELEHDKLFNVSFDLLCIAGLDGYFKELNPAWENATGYTLQELYSKPFRDFIHPEDFKKTEDEIGKLIKGKVAINFENRYIAKSGDLIDLSWTAIAVPEDSKLYCIARDVTEKKTAEKSIIEYQDRLKDLARELTIAEEKIRKQIAVDLHDHVGQMLSSARMQMTRIIDMEKDVDLVVRMKSISQTLLRAIQATRAAIFDLSPPQLNEIGLIAAVEDWMKEQIEEKHPVKIRFTNEKEPFNLDEDTRYLLFRSIKELVINVVKHAKATQIHVASYLRDNQFEIIVKDNGIGFQYNPDILKLKSNVYGLFSINERISNLGGNMYVDSKIPGGTTIKLTLPLTGKQQ